jgi:hypothetical protein
MGLPTKIIFFIGVSIFGAIIIYFFFPVKFAKKGGVITNYEKGIFVCQPEAVTGANWSVILPPEKAKPGNEIDLILLKGNAPDLKLRDFMFMGYRNKYVIKGKLLKDKDEMVKGYGLLLDVIYVKEWEIESPIRRDHFLEFMLPKRWLTPFDYKL